MLSFLLVCKQRKIPFPRCAFTFSGWFDLTLQAESLNKNKKIDPILSPAHLPETVNVYLGSKVERNDLFVSPLYANLEGLPPLFLQVGTREILLDDTVTLAKRAKEQGVEVKLEINEGQIHVYPILFYHEANSQRLLKKIACFITESES